MIQISNEAHGMWRTPPNSNSRINIFQKRDHLQAFTDSTHFLMITEPWLNTSDKYQVAEDSINCCNLFLKCRMRKEGAGVFMPARNNIEVIQLSTREIETLDSLYVQATIKGRSMS